MRTSELAEYFYSPEESAARAHHSAYLFCFPFAGAGPAAYHAFCKALPNDLLPLIARPAWRDSGQGRRSAHRIQDVAARFSNAARRVLGEQPAIFWGHSMGALVAFELARTLLGSGAPLLLIASGCRAPNLRHTQRETPVDQLCDDEFIKLLKGYGGTPQAVLESPELLEVFVPQLRADLSALESYRYVQGPKLECDILCINGRADRLVDLAGIRAWGEQTSGTFQEDFLPGGHFFINESREPTVRRICNAISGALGAIQRVRPVSLDGLRC